MSDSSIRRRKACAKRQGFTLVEIMVVVAIIGLLAAIAVPGFAKARVSSWRNACMNNLRQIDHAKQQWALESQADPDALPANSDLMPYLRKNLFPTCPGTGTYTVRQVSQIPICDQPGHGLEDSAKTPE